ncbi:type II toxin-antitoxin system RelE/ParE family toxin [Agriterribacter sp.]|uniref:type II toxin-antitoxin system RelE/ParE family toxin n=1 Tax=Agriterribacter sp. TaxID=2821509 RepID=UPI002BBD2BCB|nr:type II toxin-antitoxin system RelE/ParE family toxin [Agriterribacter sp.]HRO47865.1 type II toxin-antitoxin system RelE/ParE family toxin [Agriterribacter sp.]HRQ18839.1 type II toxin-antitoxin system RelE/ParE family toxin [Agriterribacter sp.]
MVYKVVWTLKALQTYIENMHYLETAWTEKEVKKFAFTVEKKVSVLSKQPGIGSPRNKKQQNIRHTILYKRVSLIYRINSKEKEIELLRFWNTYQNPSKLKEK